MDLCVGFDRIKPFCGEASLSLALRSSVKVRIVLEVEVIQLQYS